MSMRVGENDVIGKKSKRSKKIEVDGVEEMSDRTDVQEDGMGKSGKKGKKSKKKEMDGVEEMNDRPDESRVEKKIKKSKRSKKIEMDGVEEITDRTDVQENGIGKSGKKGKKSKKKEIDGVEEMNDRPDESRVEKKKKKRKRTVEEDDNDIGKKNSARGEDVGNSLTDDDGMVAIEKINNKKKITDRMDVQENGIGKSGKKGKKSKKKEIDGVEEMNDRPDESRVEKKKKKRKRTVEEDDNDIGKKNSARGEDVGNSLTDDDGMVAIEKVNKKKKKKKRNNEEITYNDGLSSDGKDNEATYVSKKKEKTKSVDNDPENPKSKEKKKVRFSKDVEVFPLSDTISSENEEKEKSRLVQGKRFTPQEDEILRAAVDKYIESHCLGEKGLEMVMNCKSHRQLRNCWKEIGEALPHRPRTAIYYRGHILFEGGERLEWTEEEREMLLEQYKKHGNKWKLLGKEFKRHRIHVKDTWRRIKMKRNRGHWSQEEYQSLFDLVNVDLRAKLNEEKKSKHGMLRDNICWSAISERLSTRADATCCMKWYDQLTSSMVAGGIWADSDDYRLLDALFNLDACCIEDVDWDDLIDQRSGDVCRKRWDQMVLHIGLHGVKSFAEQVEVLAKRYCPELLEAREAWDSKPLVP